MGERVEWMRGEGSGEGELRRRVDREGVLECIVVCRPPN